MRRLTAAMTKLVTIAESKEQEARIRKRDNAAIDENGAIALRPNARRGAKEALIQKALPVGANGPQKATGRWRWRRGGGGGAVAAGRWRRGGGGEPQPPPLLVPFNPGSIARSFPPAARAHPWERPRPPKDRKLKKGLDADESREARLGSLDALRNAKGAALLAKARRQLITDVAADAAPESELATVSEFIQTERLQADVMEAEATLEVRKRALEEAAERTRRRRWDIGPRER
eukprot:tig00020616_g12302.t1